MPQSLLESECWSVQKLFDNQYLIPVYQRPYSWKDEQVQSLLDDIFEAYQNCKNAEEDEKYSNGLYIGNMLLHSKSVMHKIYDVIDGQQRLVTLSLVILALYSKCYDLGLDDTNRTVQSLQAALWKLDDFERKPIQNKTILTLSSIEKDIFEKILDQAYVAPKNLREYIENYKSKNTFEENIKHNFLLIHNSISKNFDEAKDLTHFSNYLLGKIYLIAVIPSGAERKAFSIFEAINSKGKKLEDIDLIKTYIFSKLNESDYNIYLSKWGDIIANTNDDLYGYLQVYIKAYIKYPRQNISYNMFKNMEYDLIKHFGQKNIGDAYKALLDDMLKKTATYRALSNINDAMNIVNDNKLKFYYYLFLKMEYEHPKPLFFRSLIEYQEGKLEKSDLLTIFIEIIKLMISFMTIAQKDSKDIISTFASSLATIYETGKISRDDILYKINNKLDESCITGTDLKSYLLKMDLFEKSKKAFPAALLAMYDSRVEDGNLVISWDEAYSKLSTYGSSYSLDHIMNQTPDTNDINLKYYKLGTTLKLKEGNDFEQDENIHDGMEYDRFKSLILNKIGNLRLKGLDGNSARNNESDKIFCKYSCIKERTEQIADFTVCNFLNFLKSAEAYIPETNTKKDTVGIWSFTNQNCPLKGRTAKKLYIADKVYKLYANKDILNQILMYLYEVEPATLLTLADQNWKPFNRIILTRNPKGILTRAFEIMADKIYVENNLSSMDIIRYSKKILELFKIDLNQISVEIL